MAPSLLSLAQIIPRIKTTHNRQKIWTSGELLLGGDERNRKKKEMAERVRFENSPPLDYNTFLDYYYTTPARV